MKAVVGLLLILLRVSHGVELFCDARQNGTLCFGPLGGTVVLQLMDDASGIFIFRWFKETRVVLELRNNTPVTNNTEGRSVFTASNGTLRFNNLKWTDAGKYKLETYDSNGKGSEMQTLQLTVQAPVSSVLLASECLSQGEMTVSCSSKGGDSPQYNWTLDGKPLTDAQLLSGNKETNNITLKQDVSGHLVCSVRNHVSTVSKEETISTCGFIFVDCILLNGTHISQWMPEANKTQCKATTTSTTEGKETGTTVSNKPATKFTSSSDTSSSTDSPWYIKLLKIMAGILAALVVLLMVGVALVCAHRKKKSNKIKEEDDEEELTYADVKIMQRQDRQRQQRADMEVEYGQVKFSGRPRQVAEPTGDDCVYAKVCAGSSL